MDSVLKCVSKVYATSLSVKVTRQWRAIARKDVVTGDMNMVGAGTRKQLYKQLHPPPNLKLEEHPTTHANATLFLT